MPHWIPEGYTEVDVRTFDTPKQRQFSAKYQKGEDIIKIWIGDYLDTNPTQIEQSGDIIDVFEISGVKYYIVANEDKLRVAWVVESFECYISGPISAEELKQMVNSIEKG